MRNKKLIARLLHKNEDGTLAEITEKDQFRAATALEAADKRVAELEAERDKALGDVAFMTECVTEACKDRKYFEERATDRDHLFNKCEAQAGRIASLESELSRIRAGQEPAQKALSLPIPGAVGRMEVRETEFEIRQDDMPVAGAVGPVSDAAREALHYAAQYEQDGPVSVYEVTRRRVTAAELRKLAEQKEKQ